MMNEEYPRFLTYNTNRISLSIDFVNNSTTEQLVKLRDAIKAFSAVLTFREQYLDDIISTIVLKHTDFGTLQMNKGLMPQIISELNAIIGKRNLKKRQERQKEKKTE